MSKEITERQMVDCIKRSCPTDRWKLTDDHYNSTRYEGAIPSGIKFNVHFSSFNSDFSVRAVTVMIGRRTVISGLGSGNGPIWEYFRDNVYPSCRTRAGYTTTGKAAPQPQM